MTYIGVAEGQAQEYNEDAGEGLPPVVFHSELPAAASAKPTLLAPRRLADEPPHFLSAESASTPRACNNTS